MGAIGRNLESAADYVGSSIEDAFSTNSFGSSVDPSDAKYDLETGEPENLEALKLDAEYDPETGEPLNDSGKKLEQLYEEEQEQGDFDPEKSLKELGKMGKSTKQGALFSQAPPKGQLPLSMQGRVGLGSGYRQAQNPYQTPSYLMSSAQYNQQISKLLGGLLSRSIRNNPIKYLV